MNDVLITASPWVAGTYPKFYHAPISVRRQRAVVRAMAMTCPKCHGEGVLWDGGDGEVLMELPCPYCEPEPEPKPTFTIYKGRTIYWDEVVYRDYHITRSNKPFGVRGYDFAHLDWDLGDPRHGWAATIEEAKRDIDEIEEEQECGD